MTSDGFSPYVSAMARASVPRDYTRRRSRTSQDRIGEGPITATTPPRRSPHHEEAIFGAPNPDRASTAYMERGNKWTMR
jgi:hypothetical protein